MEIVHKYGHIN